MLHCDVLQRVEAAAAEAREQRWRQQPLVFTSAAGVLGGVAQPIEST